MYLIIGLGNPGKEYEKTRHNVGFLLADLFREKFEFPVWKLEKKFSALVTQGFYKDKKIILAKPQTFMNNSGESVQKIVNFYKIEPKNFWLIYDDIDLPLGKIRVREKGSAGSHNGMKSVISCLGFQNFPRLRFGIESRGMGLPKKQDITSFVLHPFLKKEEAIFKKTLEEAFQAFVLAFEFGIEKTMDKYNI